MPKTVTDQGRERTKDQMLQTAGYDASRYPRSVSIDDSTVAITAGTTTLGAPSNMAVYSAAISEVSTGRGRLTVTVPAAQGNFTIRRVLVHDLVHTGVSGTSATVYAGFDGQALLKDANTTLTLTVDLAYV